MDSAGLSLPFSPRRLANSTNMFHIETVLFLYGTYFFKKLVEISAEVKFWAHTSVLQKLARFLLNILSVRAVHPHG